LTGKSVLIFIASKDFNEQEYLMSKFTLGKNFFNVFVASDANALCIGEFGLKVKADVSVFNIHPGNFEALVVIGGKGISKYWNDKSLISVIQRFNKLGKVVAAICAAPACLANSGILTDNKATCFDGIKNQFEKLGVEYVNQPVVQSGKIITAQNQNFTKDFIGQIINVINRTIL